VSKRIAFPATLTMAFVTATVLSAQSLEISSAHERTAARGPATAYTGVGIAEFLFRANESSDLTAAEISFEPGARTIWHNHPAGQYLIVTAGVGWVQARGETKRIVRAGDVVWTPPGVFHWHGATATQGMLNLAVWEFVDGSGGELGEHVSDEEYLAESAND
jgi:quercetin dioxygenase-like cupin family protein